MLPVIQKNCIVQLFIVSRFIAFIATKSLVLFAIVHYN